MGWFSEYASDPLAVFKAASPVAKLGGSSILVYQGDFDTRLLAGITATLLAEKLGKEGQPALALKYATHARSLNPEAAYPALSLCSVYTRLQQLELATAYCHEGQARLATHREYNRDLLVVGSIISGQLQSATR